MFLQNEQQITYYRKNLINLCLIVFIGYDFPIQFELIKWEEAIYNYYTTHLENTNLITFEQQ